MLPPVHCFGVGMMMYLFAGCSPAYKSVLNVSEAKFVPYLKYFSVEAHILQGYLAISTRSSADRLLTVFTIGSLLW